MAVATMPVAVMGWSLVFMSLVFMRVVLRVVGFSVPVMGAVAPVPMPAVPMLRGICARFDQGHATFRAISRRVADHFGVHRTAVGRFGRAVLVGITMAGQWERSMAALVPVAAMAAMASVIIGMISAIVLSRDAVTEAALPFGRIFRPV